MKMNEDIFAGQWRQMKGALKSWWGGLSDNDLEDMSGQKDKLVGWVQERYGRTRDQAIQEVDAHLREYADQYGGTVANFKARAHDMGETVMGKAGEAATAVRNRVEKASSYFQGKSFGNITSDIGDFVRKYPVQSLLIGICVGVWLARHSKR